MKTALIRLAGLVALALGCVGYVHAQSVTLTSPANGSSYAAGATIPLSASTTGTVTRVRYKQVITETTSSQVGTSANAPTYADSFSISSPGTYSIFAEALNGPNNVVATSSTKTITITGGVSNVPPTISLASNPASGTTATSFTLTATAADSDGTIVDVKFYDGANLLATDPSAPYSLATTLSSGSHVLTAKATDNGGASTTSTAVNVSVTAAGAVSVTRSYVYDANERLCKTIDPEAGATVIDYDAAGNIAWTASGLSLPSTVSCDRTDSSVAAAKVTRSYDNMNRLLSVVTPGNAADVTTTYTPDGLVASLVAANGPAGANPVTTTYGYNKRRLLVAETSAQPTYSYDLAYAYNGNGHLATLTYPDGQAVTYAPDALGRATEVKAGVQTYASGISYFANGAIAGFTYGNGVVHTLTQNARLLPMRSRDVKGATVVLDDTYVFDKNGNVTDITDQAQAGLTTRGMAYDGLDRLTAAVSPQQWGNATYGYDAIDNLKVADQGTRQYRYSYDANNRLAEIKTPADANVFTFGYDANGNVTSKGAQGFAFDPANRMTTAALLDGTGFQTYRYDAAGRRVQTTDPGGTTELWIYSQTGQVLYTHEQRRNQNLSYINLGNTQVATRAVAFGTGTVTIRYQHTDSLGSPVAETDAAGAITKRNSYAPYGETYGAAGLDGTGYTGHVMDAGTGLIYMQQRYYDPQVARFLGPDPVPTNNARGSNFGRYWYANSNPYRFTDPDGRYSCEGAKICAAVRKGVGELSKSLKNLQKNDPEKAAIVMAALTEIGTKGDGKGPHYVAGHIDGDGIAKTDQKGTTKLDMVQLEAGKGNEFAKALAHEATHDIDVRAEGKPFSDKEGFTRTETNAYRATQAAAQGLGEIVTDAQVMSGVTSSVNRALSRQGQAQQPQK